MAKEEDHKWAVDTTNLDLGIAVRLIECKAEWSAQVFVDSANKSFEDRNVNSRAKMVKLY